MNEKTSPPRLDQSTEDVELRGYATRILRWFCPDHLLEELEGDLVEKFHRDKDKFGYQAAKRRMLWNAISMLRPGILMRNRRPRLTNPFHMFRHFFKIFWRSSLKEGTYSFINLFGLTAGLVVSILTFVWVLDELSFDTFHDESDRIYHVMSNHAFDSSTVTYPNTPGPLAAAMGGLPEVEHACQMTFNSEALFSNAGVVATEDGVYASNAMFSVFKFPLIEGDPRNPLPDIHSVAISERLAVKYFKGEPATGKIINIDKTFDAKVTAVFKDIPGNSTIAFDFVLPYDRFAMSDPYHDEWGAWTGGRTFVKLRNSADEHVVTKKIASQFTKPNIWTRWDDNVELFLYPLKEWRMYNRFENGKAVGGRIDHIRGFIFAAAFLVLIACINFMNLASARSVSRSREVAMRKISGAARQSLVAQFMVESMLMAFGAMALALLVAWMLLPYFNNVVERDMTIDLTDPRICAALAGIAFFTGLVSGGYPAFVMSSAKALPVLKGSIVGLTSQGTRKALVIFQFTLSVAMVIGTLAVKEQISFMQNKNLGFDQGNVLYFNTTETLRKSFVAFQQEALQRPSILSVSRANANPMNVFSEISLSDNAWPGKTKDDDIFFKWIQCDEAFLPSLGFTLLKGRFFSHDSPADTANYIITESAARLMKLSDPVGQNLLSPWKGEIIGVINDFHSTGLQSAILPAIIALRKQNVSQVFIRYRTGEAEAALHSLKELYRKYEPDYPLEFKFLDSTFDQLYRSELIIGKLSIWFTNLLILVSCLGLFGLASFVAAKRSKEVGIRKVLGASIWDMVTLLYRDLLLPVVVALIAGIPLGLFITRRFLDAYAYHIEPGAGMIVFTVALMIGMALIAVSFQSTHAAMTNPAKTLRQE